MNNKLIWTMCALAILTVSAYSSDMGGFDQANQLIQQAHSKGQKKISFRRGKISMTNAALNSEAMKTTYIVTRDSDINTVKEFLTAFTAPNIPHSNLEPKIRTVHQMNSQEQHSNDTTYWNSLLRGHLAVIASYPAEAFDDEVGDFLVKKVSVGGDTYTMVVVKDEKDEGIFRRLFEGVIPTSDQTFPIYTLKELSNPETVKAPKNKVIGEPVVEYQNELQGHLAVIYYQIYNGQVAKD